MVRGINLHSSVLHEAVEPVLYVVDVRSSLRLMTEFRRIAAIVLQDTNAAVYGPRTDDDSVLIPLLVFTGNWLL